MSFKQGVSAVLTAGARRVPKQVSVAARRRGLASHAGARHQDGSKAREWGIALLSIGVGDFSPLPAPLPMTSDGLCNGVLYKCEPSAEQSRRALRPS